MRGPKLSRALSGWAPAKPPAAGATVRKSREIRARSERVEIRFLRCCEVLDFLVLERTVAASSELNHSPLRTLLFLPSPPRPPLTRPPPALPGAAPPVVVDDRRSLAARHSRRHRHWTARRVAVVIMELGLVLAAATASPRSSAPGARLLVLGRGRRRFRGHPPRAYPPKNRAAPPPSPADGRVRRTRGR